jgi:hypothetical protein
MTDERRCAMGVLCREFKVVAGKREPALLTTRVGLCETCQRWARRCVRELPTDWCKLKLTIGENRTPAGEKPERRPRPGPKVLLNVTNDALMRDIIDTANEAAEIVAAALSITRRRTGHTRRGWSPSSQQDYQLLSACAGLIAENIAKLVADEDGLKLMRRMVLLHRTVVRHLGETLQREKQELPCPFCGGVVVKEVRDLRSRSSINGTETPEVIRCTSCDNGPNRDGTWTEAHYRWLSAQVLSEREEIEVLKWLLAEKQWECDYHAWVAAEREWALGVVAGILNIESDPDLTSAQGLIDRLRRTAVVR